MNTKTAQPVMSEELLILSLARGCSYQQSARASGCSVSTVQRRQQDQVFRAKVMKCRGEILSQSCGLLADATLTAAKKLRGLCKSKNEAVSLAACRAVLEMAGRYRDQLDLVARLEALETVTR